MVLGLPKALTLYSPYVMGTPPTIKLGVAIHYNFAVTNHNVFLDIEVCQGCGSSQAENLCSKVMNSEEGHLTPVLALQHFSHTVPGSLSQGFAGPGHY